MTDFIYIGYIGIVLFYYYPAFFEKSDEKGLISIG